MFPKQDSPFFPPFFFRAHYPFSHWPRERRGGGGSEALEFSQVIGFSCFAFSPLLFSFHTAENSSHCFSAEESAPPPVNHHIFPNDEKEEEEEEEEEKEKEKERLQWLRTRDRELAKKKERKAADFSFLFREIKSSQSRKIDFALLFFGFFPISLMEGAGDGRKGGKEKGSVVLFAIPWFLGKKGRKILGRRGRDRLSVFPRLVSSSDSVE